jgi:hypothetical protein
MGEKLNDFTVSGKNGSDDKKQNGGQNKEVILLSVDTFKQFCMKADTKKADEIHDYYIKLEEILLERQKEIDEEKDEQQRKQLEEKKKQLEDQKEELEEKDNRVKYLENKYLHQQSRVQYPKQYLIYMLTTVENKKNRIYIFGKTSNLNGRLSTYNKTCEHEVVYYKTVVSSTVMCFAESNLFLRLAKHRERLSNERFVLPEDKDISFFTNEIDATIDFFKDVGPEDRAILYHEYDKATTEEEKKSKNRLQKRVHVIVYSEQYLKYRKEYYQKNKKRINEHNKTYRNKNLNRVKHIEKMSRLRNRDKEKERKRIYRLQNKDKIKKYWLANKERIVARSKEYYKENREKKLEYSKAYNANHKVEKQEYLKKYRETNKEALKLKKQEQITCECGKTFTKSCKSKHLSSQNHITYLKSKNNVDENFIKKLEAKQEKIQSYNQNVDKEQSRLKRTEKVTCDCGDEVTRGSLTRHKKTDRHLNHIAK